MERGFWKTRGLSLPLDLGFNCGTTLQAYDAISHVTGAHRFRLGVDFRRNQINLTEGIASNGFLVLAPCVGLAWDSTGSGRTSMRAAYGISYDSFTNGVGGPLQPPLSALRRTQARQLPPPIDFTDPWNGQDPFTSKSFPQPTTVLTVENGMRC